MIQVIRTFQPAPCVQSVRPTLRLVHSAGALPTACRPALHWHLDPLTRRPTMHWVSPTASTACLIGAVR